MQVSGTNITTRNFFVLRKFRPITTHALKWRKGSDGIWYGRDRGSTEDIYETEVKLHGTESDIDNFVENLNNSRDSQTGDNILILSNFNQIDDKIFGADTDYTGSINCYVTNYGKVAQRTLNGFAVTVRLRMSAPNLAAQTLTLPELRFETGYSGNSKWEIYNNFDLQNGASYYDRNSDKGEFTGTFIIGSDTDGLGIDYAARFRYYIQDSGVGRVNTITLNDTIIPGIANFFGQRGPNLSSGIDCRIIDFDDMGMVSPSRWKYKVKIVEAE